MASVEIIPEVSGMEFEEDSDSDYDRAKEVEELEGTKVGVKGLVDSGVVKIPKFFICPKESRQNSKGTNNGCLQVPMIDLEASEGSRRVEIVDGIRRVAEKGGLFQVVHHGVSVSLLDDMLEGVRQFNEQLKKVKAQLYSRGYPISKEVTNWKDTLVFDFDNNHLNKETIPPACRESVTDYIKHVVKLRKKLSELLSEALELQCDYLSGIGCMESELMSCNYSPPCP